MERVSQYYSQNYWPQYIYVEGMITQIRPVRSRGYGSCTQVMTVEDVEGGISNFLIHGTTCIADQEQLYEGMAVTVFYQRDQIAAMVYPPQFTAAAIVPSMEDRRAYMGYFNQNLVAGDQDLKLNLAPTTQVITCNHQPFTGNPAGHLLLVLYDQTTKSIPPQTTPKKIIVMCGSR